MSWPAVTIGAGTRKQGRGRGATTSSGSINNSKMTEKKKREKDKKVIPDPIDDRKFQE